MIGTEANWLPLCNRTHFSDLLSMNSLQSFGSYCGTPSLSRSCTISAQYTVLHCREKMEALLMPVAEEADASTVREKVFFFNLKIRQIPLTS